MTQPKKEKKKKLMVSHGMVTHPAGAPCKFCDKVKREYKKEMAKPKKEYFAICSKCGDELYPNVNRKAWGAITVHTGKCPRCGKKTILIPIADWEGRGD